MNNKKIINISIAVFVCVAIVIIVVFSLNQINLTYMGYNEFCSNVSYRRIREVTIEEDSVYFKIDGNEKRYYTTNPESNNFKEFLLLNNVSVETKTDLVEIFYIVFDYLFIILFVFALYAGSRKFTGKDLFKIVKEKQTTFDNVIGLESLKKDVTYIVDILNNPQRYKEAGIRMPKGIILEGEPGNGKTLFARALAGEANVNFIPTKATDFESALMSVGPSKIKALFRLARKNSPCIIFIDEFDGIGTKRNYSGSAVETENTRIVTALLNELDGFKINSGVLVIVATNNARVLDEALIRPGRFDRKYLLSSPNVDDREKLINYYLKNKSYDEDINIRRLAEKFKNMTCAEIETVINEAAITANADTKENIIKEEHIQHSYNKMVNNIKI